MNVEKNPSPDSSENPVPAAPGLAAGAASAPPAPGLKIPAQSPAPAPTAPAEETTPDAEAPAPKPGLRLSAKPMGDGKPLTNQQIERAVKMPSYAGKFSSPMPKIDQADEGTPGWQAGLAALAAVVAVGSAVLLFLKV